MTLRLSLALVLMLIASLWHPIHSRADALKIGDKVYENVKVVEDVAQYYITVPSLGRTLSVTKEEIQRGHATIIRTPNDKSSPSAGTVGVQLKPLDVVEPEPVRSTRTPSASPNAQDPALTTTVPEISMTVKVVLVREDLSLTPVPRKRFRIINTALTTFTPIELTTSLQGEFELRLPAGEYRVVSSEPVLFEAKSYSWDVSLTAANGLKILELSNDNALVASLPTPSGRQQVVEASVQAPATEATNIYDKSKGAVVTVESELAQGTGFLVGTSGLVLTNEHVVTGSRLFIVGFSKSERYRAVLIASDPVSDAAVLRINPAAVESKLSLKLAKDTESSPAAREGGRVYAIGSPLNQEKIITSGIVSKVEANALISDVMIDHGNSGGPLLNSDGEVVGMNTFGEGRGVSGIIRTLTFAKVIDVAEKRAGMFWVPSANPLPPYPSETYPADAIKKIVLEQEFNILNYIIRSRKFDVLLLTPPAQIYNELSVEIETAKARDKKRKRKGAEASVAYDPANQVKSWGEYVGLYAPTVKVLIQPKVKATGGSVLGSLLVGSSALNYKYVAEFGDLQLLRGGEEQPFVRVGRAMNRQQFQTAAGHMEDAAYGGFAEYLPEAFGPSQGPGGSVVLVIGNELDPEKKERITVPASIVNRIQADFAPMKSAK